MGNIIVTTQGVKGGNTTEKKVGYTKIELRHIEDTIVIDDFSGGGDTYKQREQTEIRIYQNGNMLFQGSKDDLYEILKKENHG